MSAELRGLMPGFLRNRAQDVTLLEAALATGDFASIQDIGHRLRGSGGAYGMPSLSTLGEEIEAQAKRADHNSLCASVARYRQMLDVLHVEFSAT